MRPLHAQLSPRLWRRLSFSNHEANDQTGIDFRGENASIQTYRDVETGQCPCDVRNAHARRDFLIGNDERTGGKPPFGLRPTVGNKILDWIRFNLRQTLFSHVTVCRKGERYFARYFPFVVKRFFMKVTQSWSSTEHHY